MGVCQNCQVCGMSAVGGAARSSARATMHVATGGVTLVATGLKRKCGVCRHPMGRHVAQAGQNVNVTNTVSPTIVVGQAMAPTYGAAAPMPPGYAPPPHVASTPSPAESPNRLQQLRELAELRQLGALTDEEFEAEKARLMAGAGAAPAAVGAGEPTRLALPSGETDAAPAQMGWYPDPTGRHEYRGWDGSDWTAQVSDNGVEGYDPPVM